MQTNSPLINRNPQSSSADPDQLPALWSDSFLWDPKVSWGRAEVVTDAQSRQTRGFPLRHAAWPQKWQCQTQTWEEGKQTQHGTRLAWRRYPGSSPSHDSIPHAPAPTSPHKSQPAAGLIGCFVADTAATMSLRQQEGKRQTNRSAFPGFRHNL